MPVLPNPRREAFAQLVSGGMTNRQAFIRAGFSENGADAGAARMLKDPSVADRIAELKAQIASIEAEARRGVSVEQAKELVRLEISDRTQRVKILQELSEKFRQVIEERAADPALAAVPGGTTGLLVHQVKASGKLTINEYVVDTAVTRELRDILKQAAQELGQWTEKSESTQKWDGDLSSLTPDQLKKIRQQMEEIAFAGNPAALLAARAEIERETLQ